MIYWLFRILRIIWYRYPWPDYLLFVFVGFMVGVVVSDYWWLQQLQPFIDQLIAGGRESE